MSCADWDHAFTFLGQDDGYLGAGDGPKSLSLGDLNDDGFPDMVVGAPRDLGPGGSRRFAGHAEVLFGPFRRGQCWDLAERAADLRVYGPVAGAKLGLATASGDVTGDGVEDLILAAPYGPAGREGAGVVYVLPGPLSGGQQEIDLATAGGFLSIVGAEVTASLGMSIAAGDVNGDGKDDLLIAAPGATNPLRSNQKTGAAFVFFNPLPPSGVIDLAAQAADAIVYGDDDLEVVGSGDLDSDGSGDLVLGAPLHDSGAQIDAGAVYAIFGPLPAARVIDLGTDAPDLLLEGPWRKGWTGSMVIVGDVTGDGRSDLIVGSPFDFDQILSYVDVFFGPFRRGDVLGLPSGDVTIAGPGPCILLQDFLGSAGAVGDVIGDPVSDLVLGAGTACRRGSTEMTGAVYILPGPLRSPTVIDLKVAPAAVEIFGTSDGGGYGLSVALADVSTDGAADIVSVEPSAQQLSNPPRLWGGVISAAFGGQGFACLPRPAEVKALGAVRRGDDVELSWTAAADVSTTTYTVWKVLNGQGDDIRCANSAAEGASLLAACRDVPRSLPMCVDRGAVSGSPALAFYQVRGLCADGTEGLRHPY